MPFDAVLFDIDGVLVDVRKSYLESIRKAVQIYLEKILGFKPSPGSLLSLKDVDEFKLLGGFNNDWDTVYGLLLYFLRLSSGLPRPSIRALAGEKDLRALGKTLPRPCGVARIRRIVKNPGFISYAKARDLFQEIYLGPRLFQKLYGRRPRHWRRRGLISDEKLLMPVPVLRALRQRGLALGVVTGRIRFEADYVLRRFGIASFFQTVVTHDDVVREERRRSLCLRKPHPFSLLAAARRLKRKSFLYVGDLPDDVRAANAAKKTLPFRSSGVLYGQTDRARIESEFKKTGADFVIRRPSDLVRLV
jgi:HAD superfamily hydrolase (TIGR01548 family)